MFPSNATNGLAGEIVQGTSMDAVIIPVDISEEFALAVKLAFISLIAPGTVLAVVFNVLSVIGCLLDKLVFKE